MSAELDGLVLCRVGEFRLAFPAAEVAQISEWGLGDAPRLHARAAFALPPAAGRCVEAGPNGMVVDSLEISTEALTVMPVPSMLLGSIGGALLGFVRLSEKSGELCPVLAVAQFARFLAGSPA